MPSYLKNTGLVFLFICLISFSGCRFPMEEEYITEESVRDNSTSEYGIAPYPHPYSSET